jgi:flagellar assembly protein FliH
MAAISADAAGDTGQAYEQGFTDGKREGEEVARGEVAAALAALRHATQALHAQRQEIPRTMGSDLHALAVAIAAKLVEHEISADSTFIKGLIARALDLLPIDSPIEIRLHPIDMGPVRDEIERIAEEDGGRRSIQWEADATIERGGFIAEGPHRILDGRLDVALRMILERLESE